MKIILATDGSAPAEAAERQACHVGAFRDAEWIVAGVVAPFAAPILGLEPFGAPIVTEELQKAFVSQLDATRAQLDGVVERLKAQGIRASSVLLEGDAVSELCALAEKELADVVVVGHRGLSGIQDLFLGSVAKGLVAQCPASVWIGRAHPRETPPTGLTAVIGVDGSPGSDCAVDAILQLGSNAFASVFAFMAIATGSGIVGVEAEALPTYYAGEEERARLVVKSAEARLKDKAAKVGGAFGLGDPVEAICEYAASKDADVVVIGANRHGVIERLLIGSASMSLATHCTTSVWVVRPKVSG